MSAPDDFYVGYQKTAPPALGRFLRRVALGLVLLGVGVGALTAANQGEFEYGRFEFGNERTFTGTVAGEPVPHLEVPDGVRFARYPLVGRFKHGAGPEIADYLGEQVRLRATRIRNAGITMLELVPGSIERYEPPPQRHAVCGTGQPLRRPPIALGERTLRGEIVDAKCWLGVMKPGAGKTHRACASLCIRGGVPAALRVAGGDDAGIYLLAEIDGEPIGPHLLDRVAEPIEVTGRVSRHGELLVLAAPPEAFRRIERK